MTAHYIRGMQGLGDTVYSRPFVKAAAERGEDVWLVTAWPQLFADLPRVRCVAERTRLRTQDKNILRSRMLYGRAPARAQWQRWHYVGRPTMSISAALEAGFPLGPGQSLTMDLPNFGPPPVRTARPYIVIRPATVRTEWRADNRNPLPEYLRDVAAVLRADYDVISVADLAAGHEWPLQPLPEADHTFHAGELHVEQLMALVQGAAALVGPVGWIVPAALAARKPLLCIAGGQGGNNSPERLVDPRLDTKRLRFVLPDRYCRCSAYTHACDRTITGLFDHLEYWRHDNDL